MAGREEEGSLSREACQEDAGPGDGLRHVVKELEGGFHQESALITRRRLGMDRSPTFASSALSAASCLMAHTLPGRGLKGV